MSLKDLVKQSYYYTKNGMLLYGDCLEWMKEIPDGSVDMIIADPPYVISKESNFHTMPDRKNKRTGTNFGGWDDEFDNKEWINLSYKKLKSGGSLIVFNDFKKASIIYEIATSIKYEYKDTIIWHKTNPMPRNRDRRYVPNIEMLQWYIKDKNWIFNRQNEKYESCIKSYASESGGGFKRYHKTQKPVALITDLLLIHSNKGDIVLDPFLGGGTTAIACENINRKWVCIEKEEDYCKISVERLKEHLSKKS